MVHDEVTFCELKKKKNKMLKSKLEALYIKRKDYFFWASILSACIITSNLIHEAMTLMKKLFKFWECYLSIQIAYLIKKVF